MSQTSPRITNTPAQTLESIKQVEEKKLTSRNETSPTNEAVMAFEDAVFIEQLTMLEKRNCLLMVRIAYPRERANGTDDDSDIRDDTGNQDRIVRDRARAEVVDDLQDEPEDTRNRATTVNSTQVLYRS
jgi:hypothetical protein